MSYLFIFKDIISNESEKYFVDSLDNGTDIFDELNFKYKLYDGSPRYTYELVLELNDFRNITPFFRE